VLTLPDSTDVGFASTRLPTALAVVLLAAAATVAAAADTSLVAAMVVDKEVSFLHPAYRASVLTTSSGYGGGDRGKNISPINSQ
jgi:hypothetical protein